MIGENVVFTIVVANLGPNDFTNLEIREDLPSGYELVSFNATIGIYVPSTGIWSIDILSAGETAILKITAKVLGYGDYLNTAEIIVSDPIDSDTSNNISEVTIDPLCLQVYNEFSPNKDGINDTFVITCIENFPNNTLKIFNRYGSLVYEKKNYDNSWEGNSNFGDPTNNNEILPSDTYYYVLEMGNEMKSKMGWLFLIK